MNDKKNIDQLFQDKFKDLEVIPNPEIWNNIEAKLKKKKKRILPIWWFSGGVAATLVLGLLIYPLFTKKENEFENIKEPIIVSTPKKNIENKELEPKKENIVVVEITEKEKTISKEKKQTKEILVADKNFGLVNKKDADEKRKKTSGIEGINPVEKNAMEKNFFPIVKEKKKEPEIRKDSVANLKPKKDFIAEMSSKDSILSEKKNHNKWAIAPTVAIIATNSFTKSSSLDKSLISSPTEGTNTFSYGIKVAYHINEKWSIQSGIHMQKLDYSNKNLSVVSNTLGNNLLNVDYNNKDAFSINTSESLNVLSSVSSVITSDAVLTQSYGYIEIPIEVKYSVFSTKKINTRFVTGFSSMFLQKNEIAVSSAIVNRVIGKANNLNSLNFSGNLGLDLDYSINKNIQLNFNPMFKVQLNTFSKNANGFKPYSIGFYTGIKYQF